MPIMSLEYDPITGEQKKIYGQAIPEFPTYKARPVRPGYAKATADISRAIEEFPTMGEYPEVGAFPSYEPGAPGAYPVTRPPTYEPTKEPYPEYQPAVTGGVGAELQETIEERMRGEGTAGAESAIYQRGEARVQEQYEEGLERIDEEMGARGLIGSGIHGEAISELETERQKSLADLSRQVTIYGQQAIESAMQKGQQYVAFQASEAAREVQTRERGWGARVGESIRKFESEARAAEVAGRSEEAAFQHATAEKIRGYEAQARAWQATTTASMQKWQDKANLAIQKSQLEMQKGQMLLQARARVDQMANEEYYRAYQSRYQATKDTYLAQVDAREAAERKRQAEWVRERERIEQQIRRRAELAKEGFFSTLSGAYVPTGGGVPEMTPAATPTETPTAPTPTGPGWPAYPPYRGETMDVYEATRAGGTVR